VMHSRAVIDVHLPIASNERESECTCSGKIAVQVHGGSLAERLGADAASEKKWQL
jgi:hypothetical protein